MVFKIADDCVCFRENSTWNPFTSTSSENGVQGYGDLLARGLLGGAGLDLRHMRAFFQLTGITMVGLVPDFTRCGSNRNIALCAFSANTAIVYATPSSQASLSVNLTGDATWIARCFDVHTGVLSVSVSVSNGSQTFMCPSGFVSSVADRVIVFTR